MEYTVAHPWADARGSLDDVARALRPIFWGLTALSLLAALLAVATPEVGFPTTAAPEVATAETAGSQTVAAGEVPEGLTATEWSSIQQQIAAQSGAAAGSVQPATVAANPTLSAAPLSLTAIDSALTAALAPAAITFAVDDTERFSLATVALNGAPVQAAAVYQAGERVVYERPGLIEWYEPVTGGIEQGFTVTSPAPGPTLTLDVNFNDVASVLVTAPTTAVLTDHDGATFSYRDLYVFDAAGTTLPAWLSSEAGTTGVTINVDHSNAVYPITIDPIIGDDQKLLPPPSASGNLFGTAVATDGDVVAVVAPHYATNADDSGAVFVFRFDGSDYTLEATLADGTTNNAYGTSLAIAGDRILVGDEEDDENGANAGAVYVYDRVGGIWGLTAKLYACGSVVNPVNCDPESPPGGYTSVGFGGAVDLADVGGGSYTMIVGARGTNTSAVGDAWVIQDVAGTRLATERLRGDVLPFAQNDWFGHAVAISPDGNNFIVGAPKVDGGLADTGAAYTFTDADANGDGVNIDPLGAVPLTYSTTSSANLGFAVDIANSGFSVVGAPSLSTERFDTGENLGEIAWFFPNGSVKGTIAPFATISDGFGNSLELDSTGGKVIVGAPWVDLTVVNGGRAVLCDWDAADGIVANCDTSISSDNEANDRQGWDVAINTSGHYMWTAPYGNQSQNDDVCCNAFFGIDSGSASVQRGATRYTVNPSTDSTDVVFGAAVAIDGNTMVVGAPRENEWLVDAGAAYVFTRPTATDPWVYSEILRDVDPRENGSFGSTVAIDGDRIAVGAPYEPNAEGRVILFERSGGTFSETFLLTGGGADDLNGPTFYIHLPAATAGSSNNRFGESIAIIGDLVLVGAPKSSPSGGNFGQGTLYAWRFNGNIVASSSGIDGAAEAPGGVGLGYAVDGQYQSGDVWRAVAGAPDADTFGANSGNVQVFDITATVGFGLTFNERSVSAPIGPLLNNQNLGRSVSIDQDVIVAGEANSSPILVIEDVDGDANWESVESLAPTGVAAIAGVDLDMTDQVIAAAWQGTGGGIVTFARDSDGSWLELDDLEPAGVDPTDTFGADVGLDGNTVIGGAPNDDDSGAEAGAAYSFTRSSLAPGCTAWWDGGVGDNDWFTPGNWVTNQVPGTDDIVCLDNGDLVQIDTDPANVAAIFGGNHLNILSDLTLNGGSSFVTSSHDGFLGIYGGSLTVDFGLEQFGGAEVLSGFIAANEYVNYGDMVLGDGSGFAGDLDNAGGTIVIDDGASVSFAAASAVVNGGIIRIDGAATLTVEGDLVNDTLGIIDFDKDGNGLIASSGTASIINLGVISVGGFGPVGATSTKTIGSLVQLDMEDGSVLEVNDAQLDVYADGVWNGTNTLIVDSDGIVVWGGDQTIAGTVVGAGTVGTAGGLLFDGTKTSTGAATFNFPAGSFGFGIMADMGNATIAGDWKNFGRISRSQSFGQISGNFLNDGEYFLTGGPENIAGTFQNDGTMELVSPGGAITASGLLTQNGHLEVVEVSDLSGVTYATTTLATTLVQSEASLTTGLYTENGAVVIREGAAVQAGPGSVLSADATLDIDIAGNSGLNSNYGQYVGVGTLTLDGTLNATLVGYTPIASDSYPLVACIGGCIDNGIVVNPPSGLTSTIDGNGIDLSFAAAASTADPDVSANRELIAVSSPTEDVVYLAVISSNGSFDTRQTIPAPTPGVDFGAAVAIWGPNLVVGAPGEDTVYRYQRSGPDRLDPFTLVDTIVGSTIDSGDGFGLSIDLYEDQLIVGAPFDGDVAPEGGSATIFKINAIPAVEGIVLSDGDVSDSFGATVAIDAGVAWVGAPNDDGAADVGPFDQGAIYRYDNPDFTFDEVVRSATPAAFNNLGAVMDATNSQAVASTNGSVSVFTNAGAITEAALAPSAGATATFGDAVSIEGDRIIVNDNAASEMTLYSRNGSTSFTESLVGDPGAPMVAVAASSVAMVGTFIPAGPTTIGPDLIGTVDIYPATANKLFGYPSSPGDNFGSQLDVDGDTLIVVSRSADRGTELNNGEAYVFTRVANVWSYQQTLDDASGYNQAVTLQGNTAVFGRANGFTVYTRPDAASPFTLLSDVTHGGSPGAPNAIDLDGEVLIVGFPNADGNTGTVAIYTGAPSTWSAQSPQTFDGDGANDYYGFDVAVSGDAVVVGAPRGASFIAPPAAGGSAQVLKRPDSGSPFALSIAYSSLMPGDMFGWDVEVDDDRYALASPLRGAGGGDVSLYDTASLTFVENLPNTTGGNDRFGYAMDLDAGVLAVGTWTNEVVAYDIAAVGGATIIDTLTHDDFDLQDNTAGSHPIATSNGDVISGARLEDEVGRDAGAVYTFEVTVPVDTVPGELIAPTGNINDGFGHSIDIHEDWMIVGSPNGNGSDIDSGVAFLFKFNGTDWVYTFTLFALAEGTGAEFGASVSLAGQSILANGEPGNLVAAVGAPNPAAGPGSGSVYFFELPGGTSFWNPAGSVTGNGTDEGFGAAIDLELVAAGSGQTSEFLLVTGAPVTPAGGAAYLHSINTFGPTHTEIDRVIGSGDSAGDQFGADVALDDNLIAIGQPMGDPGAVADAGTAQIWETDGTTMTLSTVLTEPAGNISAGDGFGNAVDLDGDTLVVGASADDQGGTGSGSAYVFRMDPTWGTGTQLTVGDNGEAVGANVAVENGVVLVSAAGAGIIGQGTVYEFRNLDGWTQSDEFTFTGEALDAAGTGLALSETGHVAIGAPSRDTTNGIDSGSAQTVFTGIPDQSNAFVNSSLAGGEPALTGYSVDVDGEWLVVGSPQRLDEEGAVQVFRDIAGNWTLVDTLVDNINPNFDSQFGRRVAVANDTIYVGECEEGWIWEFDGATWLQGDIIDVPAGINACAFTGSASAWGTDVDLSDDGDVLVIGSASQTGTGTVTVLRQTGGLGSNFFEDTVNPPAGAIAASGYGADVALSGENLYVIGTENSDLWLLSHAAGVWTEADSVTTGGGFAVDADDNTILVGLSSGAGEVYRNNAGVLTLEATLPAGASQARFGGDVSIDQNLAVIGQTFGTVSPVGRETGVASYYARSGTSWSAPALIASEQGEQGDAYGFSVNVQGPNVVVGAPFDTNGADPANGDGVFAGAAYTFSATNPVDDPFNKLIGTEAGEAAGRSVAVADDKLIIGAPNANGGEGTVYAFTRDDDGPWTFEAELAPPVAIGASDGYGQTVALAGSEQDQHYAVAVGTLNASDVYLHGWTDVAGWGPLMTEGSPTVINGAGTFGISMDMNRLAGGFRSGAMVLTVGNTDTSGGGEVTVYRVEADGSTTFIQILTGSTSDAGEAFGNSVAVDGDTIIVGNPGDNISIAQGGSATVFRADTQDLASWSEEAVLLQPDALTVTDVMGSTVDVDNGVAIVGLPLDSSAGGGDAGSALIFTRTGTTWDAGVRLTPSDAQPTDQYGSAVVIEDGFALVGARGAIGASGKVVAYTLFAGVWSESVPPLQPGDTQPGDRFGSALAISDSGDLVVGASGSDTSLGLDGGGAYTYDLFLPAAAKQIVSSNLFDGDALFGADIMIDGDTMIVSSSQTDVSGVNEAGTAFVFTRTGGVWSIEQALPNPTPTSSDRYGRRVGVQGDVAVVADGGDGIHTWTRSGTTWTYDQLLVPAGGLTSGFGTSIDFNGTTLAVADKASGQTGTVYVFERTPATNIWTEQIVATPGDQTTNSEFRIAVDGDNLLVAAAQHPATGAASAGRVYAYTRTGATWTQSQIIDNPEGDLNDFFGSDVDISGTRAIIGARGDNEVAGSSGAAFVFDLAAGTWADTAKLTPASQESPSDYGRSVAIDGNIAVMGSILDQVQGLRSGQALVFGETAGTWMQTGSLEPADRESRQYFASALSIDGTTVAVGAPFDNNRNGPSAGAIYTYTAVTPPTIDDPTLTFGFDLAAGSPTEVAVAPTGLSISSFNAEQLEDAADDNTTISASPLSAIELDQTPLSAIEIGDTPLSAIVLGSTPLSAIPIVNIDIDEGWDDIVAGTELENRPLNDINFGDILGDPVAAARVASTPLSAIDVNGTPLSAIPLSAIALGTTPLSAIPLSAINLDWCDVVSPYLADVTCATEADLTDVTLMEATLRGVPLSAIPLSAIPLSAIPLSAIPLSAIPLSAINFEATPLSAIPLSAIPLSAIPLSAIPLSAIPLSAIPLSAIPLSAIDVAGSDLSTIPLSAIPLSAIPASVPLSAIPLSAIEAESTPLSAIPLSAIVLADVPLSAIPLSAIDGSPIDWCTLLAEIGFADCESGIDPATTTLSDLSVRGVPLSAIPLSAIPLSAIEVNGSPLSAIPLSAIPLSAIPLSAIPLSAIPLSAINLQDTPLSAIDPTATPLSAIPLSAIPLSAIDVAGSPLSAIPLSAIDVGSTPLSAIPLSAIPLSAIPLSAIPLSAINLNGTFLEDLPLSAIDVQASPLSAIPLSAIPLSAIGVNCALVDCENGSLGDALLAGALDPTAVPLSAIPLSAIRIGDLADHLIGITRADIIAAIQAWGGLLSDLDGLDDMTLGDLPSFLPQVRDTLLGQLEGGDYVIRFEDLVGALIDPGTGLPFSDTDASAALRTAIDALGEEFGDFDNLSDVTLGELLANSDGGYTLDELGPLLRLIKVQDLLDQLVGASAVIPSDALDIIPDLGDLTLADLYAEGITEFDTFTLGGLLQALSDAGLLQGFTLGDLLLALVGADGLPVGGVDFSTIEVGQLPDNAVPSVTFETTVSIGNTTKAHGFEVEVTLPSAATFLPGSSMLVVTPDLGGPLPAQLAPPTVDGNKLRWNFTGVGPANSYAISFDVKPEIALGSTTLSSTAKITGTDTAASGQASIAIAEGIENNNYPPTTGATEDSVYLFYLPDETDDDVFEVTVQENDRLAVELSNLPADFDIALYADADDPGADTSLSNEGDNDPIVAITDPDGTSVDAEVQDDFRRLDLEDDNLRLINVSNARGTVNELLITDRLPAGTYYVQVHGANGASSPAPAALQLQVIEAENRPPCLPRGALPAATPGTLGAIDPATNTVVLVNEQRLEQIYSAAERGAVLTQADAMVAYLDANPQLGINAQIVPVDSNAVVRAAYAQLDNPANPEDACAAETANAVVGAIVSEVLDPIRATNDIEHIVFVGGDDILPMARLRDSTAVANEYDFRHEFDGDLVGGTDISNAFSSTFWEQTFLSDEPYGETASQSLGDRFLYVSDAALGRLVETPQEMIDMMASFVTYEGSLDVTTGAVLGYDFLADGSAQIGDDLSAVLGSANVDDDLADGIDASDGQKWDRVDAENILVPASGDSPDLISLNAHFDHYRALPAVGDQVAGFTDNLLSETIADALPESVLDTSLIFSMGCHSGLSVSDVQVGATNNDWAQTFAGQGAQFIGNTGFGYGDTETVAYSERLMALFAENVVGPLDLDGAGSSTTVGQALTFAKQEYISQLSRLSVYDEKALMESTFYGLPFYQVGVPSGPVDPIPTNDPTPDATGTDALLLTLDAENNLDNTARGVVYSNPDDEGDPLTIVSPGRPIQPKVIADISVVDPASDASLLDKVAHGAIVLGMDSTYLAGVDPVVATAIFDEAADQPEPALGDVVFPAQPVRLADYNAPGGERQNLVVATGQFRSAGLQQRLDDNIDLVVYYSGPDETDFTPPSIGKVTTTVTGNTAAISVKVSDNTAVDRVYVLLVEDPVAGSATWQGIDLAPAGGGVWTSTYTASPGTQRVEFLVQAKDPAGNVGVATNKASNFNGDEVIVDPPPVDDLVVGVSGPLDAPTGWYTGPATVTATTVEAIVTYSVDGSAFVTGTTFTIGGEGVHGYTVRTGNGQEVSGTVRIDTQNPTVQVGPPIEGTSYPLNGGLTLGLLCSDAGIGVSSCDATLDGVAISPGDPLDAAPGAHTVVATATDGLGRTDTVTVNFNVDGATDPLTTTGLSLTGNPGLGQTVTAQLDFAGGVTPYVATIDWGDGTSCTTPAADCSIVEPNGTNPGSVLGSHDYATLGGYTVTVTLTDANGAGDSVSDSSATALCTITGTNNSEWILGTAGPDVICAKGGNDVIFGSSGNDLIYGNNGNDYIVGGSGDDVIFGSSGNDLIVGNDGDDKLWGQSGIDWIFGDDGNDEMYGGGGNDILFGGTGDDSIRGHSGDDVLLGENDDDTLRGGSGDDAIRGGRGNDTMFGQRDDDDLGGGPGADTANGGSNFDVCRAEVKTECEA